MDKRGGQVLTQNILTVDVERFREQVHKVGTKTLLNLFTTLMDLKWEAKNRVSDDQVLDIARKESIIQGELQRRGYINKRNKQEFEEWYKKINFRKGVY